MLLRAVLRFLLVTSVAASCAPRPAASSDRSWFVADVWPKPDDLTPPERWSGPADGRSGYFPSGTDPYEEAERGYLAEALDRLGEAPLVAAPGAERALRYLYLPARGSNSFVVRLSRGESWTLVGKRDVPPAVAPKVVQRKLTVEEAARLDAWLARLPSVAHNAQTIGRDGAEWLFEYVDDDSHLMFRQWSPQTGEARAFGLFLASLFEASPR